MLKNLRIFEHCHSELKGFYQSYSQLSCYYGHKPALFLAKAIEVLLKMTPTIADSQNYLLRVSAVIVRADCSYMYDHFYWCYLAVFQRQYSEQI